MPTKVWASNEELKAVDVNTYLSAQAVMVFADSAARSAAIPTPTVGMTTYLVSTGALEIYTDKTSPPSWRPPWNTAWGLVYNAAVADITWNVTFQAITPTLPCNLPGRNYKVELEINVLVGAPVAQTFYLQVFNGGVGGTYGAFAQNNGWWMRGHISEIVLGATSNDIKVQARVDTSAATSWGRCRVIDVGPS